MIAAICLLLTVLFVFLWTHWMQVGVAVIKAIEWAGWAEPPRDVEVVAVGTCTAYGYNPFDQSETPRTVTPNVLMYECFRDCMGEPELQKDGTYRAVLPGGVRLFTPTMSQ